MYSLKIVLSEILANFTLIRRLAKFNLRARFSDNYLGALWTYLEPLIYISTYFVVFGLGVYSGTINGQPYLLWMLAGIVPWYYVMGSFNQGLKSISNQLTLLTKTQYPLSIAPVIPMYQEIRRFLVMFSLFFLIMIIGFGEPFSIYWLQMIYSMMAMVATVLAHNLINSTIAVLVPDYRNAVSALFRLIFFTSGVVVNVDARGLPFVVSQILKMFPFYYVLQSFRETFIFHTWFWEKPTYTVYFWSLTFLMLLVGATIHLKYRDQFVDKA